jgi:alkylhydroperoxidase/carboxymuconolactone decarboxylase family protein YurZ
MGQTEEILDELRQPVQCDGTIASPARGAARRGATADEVAELLGVAILMNGRPGRVHAPRALAAFEEFATKT